MPEAGFVSAAPQPEVNRTHQSCSFGTSMSIGVTNPLTSPTPNRPLDDKAFAARDLRSDGMPELVWPNPRAPLDKVFPNKLDH